jgi:hypothetical protein
VLSICSERPLASEAQNTTPNNKALKDFLHLLAQIWHADGN